MGRKWQFHYLWRNKACIFLLILNFNLILVVQIIRPFLCWNNVGFHLAKVCYLLDFVLVVILLDSTIVISVNLVLDIDGRLSEAVKLEA